MQTPILRRRRASSRAGFTLIEVMVATMITAALAVALVNVALTTKTTSVMLDRKVLAGQATKALQSALKAYVTGDPLSVKSGLCGPNTYNGAPLACNTNMWCLTNAVQVDTTQPGGANACYALNPGTHTIYCNASGEDSRCVLPWALRQPPYNGYVVYTVTGSPPKVTINVNWTEP